MLPRSLLLFLSPVLCARAFAAIDLTPAVTDLTEDGVSYREVSFKTPEGKLLFTLPSGWTIRGQKDRAQLTATDKSTEAVIEALPLQKPEALDDAAITKFKQQVLAALPAGSTKVTTVSEAENSMMPGGNPSFEIVITYDLWGKVFQRSALLVNGPLDRLIFRFTCLKSEFPALNTNFRRSLMTWHLVAAKGHPEPIATKSAPPSAAN